MSHSSIVGGSNADRLLNCPGSYQQIMALPPTTVEKPSEYALEGSAMHEVMALVMRARLGGYNDSQVRDLAQWYVGETVSGRVISQDDMDSMILPALDALAQLEAAYGGDFQVRAVEQSVNFPGIPGARGTCDLVLSSYLHVLHVDWKFGQGVPVLAVYDVSPDEERVNPQLLFYTAATLHNLPKLYSNRRQLVAAIIQPRSETPLSHTVITRKEVKNFVEDLQAAVEKALDRDPPLWKGEHCRWCPAKIICPLWTAPMLQIADTELLPRTEVVSDQVTAYGQYLSAAKELADRFTLWKKEVDEQLHAYLEDGGRVPGWRLKPAVKKRQWADTEKVADTLKELGFEEVDIWKESLQTFTHTDAAAKRLGVKIPDHLRITPLTDETTVCRTDDPAPEVIKSLAIEQFRQALTAISSR